MGKKSSDLEKIAEGLDISPSMHKYAVERYQGIAKYLEEKGIIADFSPQGSFRTGTVTRPMRDGKETDFDIDVVCTLTYDKRKISAKEVKKIVGEALCDNKTYKEKLLPEDDRCWSLAYANITETIGLMMDIVPSVPEDSQGVMRLMAKSIDYKYAKSALSITDRKNGNYYWLPSNPEGFGLWFDEINEPFLQSVIKEQKEYIYNNYRSLFGIYASVEEVPDYYVKSPLQRVIQILKRHRDIYYYRNDKLTKLRPASIIITSLAARIAQNASVLELEELLACIVNEIAEYVSLLQGIVPKARYNSEIRNLIQKVGGKWYIPNPVDSDDNYADGWDDKTAKAFFEWIKVVKRDLSDTQYSDNQRYITGLKTSFGKDYVNSKLELKEQEFSYSQPATITNITKPWGE